MFLLVWYGRVITQSVAIKWSVVCENLKSDQASIKALLVMGDKQNAASKVSLSI